MTEVMIQEMEDAAAWLLTIHGEELMQEAAVPKKIVAEDFFGAELRRYTIQL